MRSRTSRGNIFVANLPPDFDDEKLAEVFDPFGIVLSAHVARDPENGRRLRYGFVDIATERAAQRAIGELNGVAVEGHVLDVRLSERKAPGAERKRAPRPAPRRPAPAESENGEQAHRESEPAAPGFAPARRRTAGFVVERRPLPRRI